jgi:hypothetical protein
LQIGVVSELVSPSQGLSQHKEHLLEICNRYESSSLKAI